MRTFERIVTWVSRVLGYLGGAAVLALVVHILLDTTLRTLFSAPLDGTLIWSQYWYMVLLGFGGWALAGLTRQHIDAPILGDRISGAWQHVWEIFIQVACALFLGLIVFSSWGVASHSLQINEYQGAGVPIWPTRFFVPIAAAAFLAVAVLRLVESIVHVARHEPEPPHPVVADDDELAPVA